MSNYQPTPETHFMGYKCPFYVCDLIVESHDSCHATRLRLNAMGNNLIVSDKEFHDVFMFNFSQFSKKHRSVVDDVLASYN